jgi:hypothetical protein
VLRAEQAGARRQHRLVARPRPRIVALRVQRASQGVGRGERVGMLRAEGIGLAPQHAFQVRHKRQALLDLPGILQGAGVVRQRHGGCSEHLRRMGLLPHKSSEQPVQGHRTCMLHRGSADQAQPAQPTHRRIARHPTLHAHRVEVGNPPEQLLGNRRRRAAGCGVEHPQRQGIRRSRRLELPIADGEGRHDAPFAAGRESSLAQRRLHGGRVGRFREERIRLDLGPKLAQAQAGVEPQQRRRNRQRQRQIAEQVADCSGSITFGSVAGQSFTGHSQVCGPRP